MASSFFVVIDHDRRLPAGVLGMIAPLAKGPGLKSGNDVVTVWGTPASALLRARGVAFGAEETFDLATLAVAKDYQHGLGSGLVSLALYQSVVRSCRTLGIVHLVAVLDSVLYRATRVRYAEPFVACGEPRPYLGSSASVPVYCNLDQWEERLALTDPHLRDIIYGGQGLEAACSPLDPSALARHLAWRSSSFV